MNATTNASLIKLRDGSWGAKVQSSDVVRGQTITITTKSGKSWDATITRVVWSGDGVAICVAENLPGPSRYTRRQREQMGDRYAGTRHDGVYCGYPCPVTGKKCCPSNGPCHDCM